MGKKRKSSGRERSVRDGNLGELPQVADEVWQADIRRSPAWVRIAGVLQRPWMILVTNSTEDLVLAHAMPDRPPSAEMLWENLAEAMQSPEVGIPHRPAQVHLRAEPLRQALLECLEGIGIQCLVRGKLEHLEFVLDDLAKHLQGGRSIPSLVEVPGVESAQVARYFKAAAEFYRRRPWEHVTSDTPIKVECGKFESGPWYAVVMGQSGMVYGLALHEGEEVLNAILAQGEAEMENIRKTSAISLMYGEKFEISVKDLDAADDGHWSVANPAAYPFAIRGNPGRAVRAPLSWELQLLEACLWALPDFLRLGAAQGARVKVPSVAEDMELRLSWASN